MVRIAGVVFGILSYVVFFVTFVYSIGFIMDIGVPRTLDTGPVTAIAPAVVIDLALLGLFAVQHSGMARPGFKRWLTAWFPASIERSTYVLLASATLILVFWQWRPIDGTVWQVESSWAVWALNSLCLFGFLFVLTATFVINHFDLFGLRQVWLNMRKQPYTALEFKERFHYRFVRHPLMLGFIIAFWAAPHMTFGHLLFAAASTGYILLALQLEERDLITMHGDDYRRYKDRVPGLVPMRTRTNQATSAAG
ncbi:MAG TPA: NnrU family protein [Pseudomonadales bacterium]|nr:NnrU family protein [Pseudomonadales bacterium]